MYLENCELSLLTAQKLLDMERSYQKKSELIKINRELYEMNKDNG